MNFTLTINGESPAELLTALQQLNVPAALQQPQNAPAPQLEKPKAPAPAKQKKPAQKPAAAPAEKQPEPQYLQDWTTNTASEVIPAKSPTIPATPPAAVPDEPRAVPSAQDAPSEATPSEATATAPSSEPEKDPVTEDKIRSLIMALMTQGRRAECQKIVTDTGAKGISTIPPASYTDVWEKLCGLADEVNGNAAG